MCVFVYALPQFCGHTHFQNVAECAVARGLSSAAAAAEGDQQRPRAHPTLASPVFLFDTARDTARTPETYAQRFACEKRRAVRPVPTFCEGCARKIRRGVEKGKTAGGGEKRDSRESKEVKEEFLAVPAVASSGSSGSSAGLVAASGSASEVGTSGMFCF